MSVIGLFSIQDYSVTHTIVYLQETLVHKYDLLEVADAVFWFYDKDAIDNDTLQHSK
jgi:hypothetical protein